MASKRGTFSFLLFVLCVASGYKLPETLMPVFNMSDSFIKDNMTFTNLSTFFDALKSVTNRDTQLPMADVNEMMCNCTYLLERIQLMRNCSLSTEMPNGTLISVFATAEELCEQGTGVPMMSLKQIMISHYRLTKREIRNRIKNKLGHNKCKNISLEELRDLQPVAEGLPICLLKRLKAKEILQDRETLRNITKRLKKGQLKAMFQGLSEHMDPSEMLQKLPEALLPMIPQNTLKKVNLTAVKIQKWSPLQSVCLAKTMHNCQFYFRRQGSVLQCLTCEKIVECDTQDMQRVRSENSTCLSKVQARCAAKTLFDTLAKGRKAYFKNITLEEVDMIHPLLLAYLPSAEMKDLPDYVCPIFLRKMEMANMNLLPLHDSFRLKLLQKTLDCLENGKDLSALTPKDMSRFEQLMCWLSASQLRRMTPDVVKSSLQNMTSCRHIPQSHIADLKQLIMDTYGDPSDLSAETMKALGPLLVLDDNAISSLPNKPWMKDVLFSMMPRMTHTPCALKKKLFNLITTTQSYAACRRRAANITDVNDDGHTQAVPTVRMIKALGKYNSYWTAAQLDTMSNKTFFAAVETLGSITDFSADQLTVLNNKAIQTFGPVSQMREDVLEQMGCINKAFSNRDLESLPFTLDIIKDIANCGWNNSQMTSLWKAVAKNDNLTAQTLTPAEILTLDQILCGLNFSEIGLLNKESFRDALGWINGIKCSSTVAQQLKGRLFSVFGTPNNWSEAQVCESGNIIAAFDSSEWASLPPPLFPFVKETSIPLIDPSTMKDFSVEQLKNLGPDNAAMVTSEQQEMLSNEQRAALEEALTGTPVQTPKTSNSGVPALGVEGTSAFLKPLLFFLMAILLL